MFIAGVTVTIIRGVPGFDAYGDPVAGTPVDGWGDEVTFAGQPIRWSEPTLIDLPGVTLAPRVGGPGTASSDIEGRGREGARVGFTMYAEVGADIRRTDLVEINVPGFEGIYKIDGEPSSWVSPFDGWRAGVEVALTRAEG